MTERFHFHFSLSCIGEGNGSPLQCSCLENLRDRGAWWAAVYGVEQSWTRLKWLSSSSCMQNLSFLIGVKPHAPLQWKHRVLTTGPPGKFPKNILKSFKYLKCFLIIRKWLQITTPNAFVFSDILTSFQCDSHTLRCMYEYDMTNFSFGVFFTKNRNLY